MLAAVLFAGLAFSGLDCEITAYVCQADTRATYVEVRATHRSVGTSSGSDTHQDAAPAPEPTPTPRPTATSLSDWDRGNYTVVTFPDVTIEDLASFRPSPPDLVVEPDSLGLVGLASNFVAGAGPQVMTGELFDFPVTVRFTPESYTFDHGDGTSTTSADGGDRWAALGAAEFTATATSHSYAVRGTYAVAATVSYAAAVDFGGGWRQVPGTVQATATASVRVLDSATALVASTCDESPDATGC